MLGNTLSQNKDWLSQCLRGRSLGAGRLAGSGSASQEVALKMTARAEGTRRLDQDWRMHFQDGSFTCGRAGGLSSLPRGLHRAACGMATGAQVGDKGGHHPKSHVFYGPVSEQHSLTPAPPLVIQTDVARQPHELQGPWTTGGHLRSRMPQALGENKFIGGLIFLMCQKEICISIEGLGLLIMGTQKINQT